MHLYTMYIFIFFLFITCMGILCSISNIECCGLGNGNIRRPTWKIKTV